MAESIFGDIYGLFSGELTDEEIRQQQVQGLFGSPVRVEGTMQSQEFDEQGNPINQQASVQAPDYSQSTGLFQNLPQEQVPLMQAAKQMVGNADPLMQKQGYSALEELMKIDDVGDRASARTFAMGAEPEMVDGRNINQGKMIRAMPANNEKGFETFGSAYDPRNPYINTGTEFTNYNQPSRDIPINLEAAEQKKQLGKSGILSRFKQIDELKATEGGRAAGMKKAEYFYDKLKEGKMSSGGMRMMLSYLPFTFTEQGRMDEEFNAFAETAARQALKASGEIRPTDADVTGMKKAMFGIGRDEQVNIRLLQNFMESIKRDDHRAFLTGEGNKYQESKKSLGASPVNSKGWELMTDANGNSAYVSPNGEVEEIE